MMPNGNEVIKIHSYKHDKSIHRVWNNAMVLDVFSDYIVLGNYKTKVIESNGRYWNTKEPAICFFYTEKWFNVIAMLKEDGIYYYCNISSPFVYDKEAVKYIDYDLDLRIDPDFHFKILDRDEFEENAIKMNYGEKLKVVIEHSLENVIKMVKEGEGPFNHDLIKQYFNKYRSSNTRLKEESEEND